MRISTKGRYGLAAMIYLGEHAQSGSYIPLIQLADALGISKIYLEQVFSLLKRADLIRSTKGTQGGYQLAKPQQEITAYAILHAIEQLLFEPAEPSVQQQAPEIEQTMQQFVFDAMDAPALLINGRKPGAPSVPVKRDTPSLRIRNIPKRTAP